MTDEERRQLRKMPYPEFLKSEFWREIKVAVRERADDICEMCGDSRQTVLEVHHRTYEHRGWEDLYLTDLLLLCDDCHEDVHRKGLMAWPYTPHQYAEREQ